jgi:hypothetical protein
MAGGTLAQTPDATAFANEKPFGLALGRGDGYGLVVKMWIGNLDGSRQGLVIAPSKKRAREIVGASRSDFDGHWAVQDQVDENLEFEKLYTRVFDENQARWTQGRCKLKTSRC